MRIALLLALLVGLAVGTGCAHHGASAAMLVSTARTQPAPRPVPHAPRTPASRLAMGLRR